VPADEIPEVTTAVDGAWTVIMGKNGSKNNKNKNKEVTEFLQQVQKSSSSSNLSPPRNSNRSSTADRNPSRRNQVQTTLKMSYLAAASPSSVKSSTVTKNSNPVTSNATKGSSNQSSSSSSNATVNNSKELLLSEKVKQYAYPKENIDDAKSNASDNNRLIDSEEIDEIFDAYINDYLNGYLHKFIGQLTAQQTSEFIDLINVNRTQEHNSLQATIAKEQAAQDAIARSKVSSTNVSQGKLVASFI
jgi:hypothetical protein